VISVVIPARNQATRVARQLDALEAQTYAGVWEVIVVDNGSTDETAARALAYSSRLPGLRVVDASTRRGVNHARNVGASVARGDFLLFCDADDVVTPTWVERMAEAAETCDAVGGGLEKVVPATRGAAPVVVRSDGLWRWSGFLPFPSGANCGVRAALLRELEGFDERYVGGGDDVHFFWRLQLHGHHVCSVPDAVVRYEERRTLREVAVQSFRYGVGDPRLFADFRGLGMPRRSLFVVVREWLLLLVLAPWYWIDRARRRHWVKRVARKIGRVSGSIRLRVLYL
jgi:glycosyltransferase involved in cell wall biosynthesis